MKTKHFYKLFFILSLVYWICANSALAELISDENRIANEDIDPGTGYMVQCKKDNKFITFYDCRGNHEYFSNGEFEKMRFVFLPRVIISFDDIEPFETEDPDYVAYDAELQIDYQEYKYTVWEEVKYKFSKEIPLSNINPALTGVTFSSPLDSRIKVPLFETDAKFNLGGNTTLNIHVPIEKSDSFRSILEKGRSPLFITFSFNCILHSIKVNMIVEGSEKEKISAAFGEANWVTEKRFWKVFNDNFPRHSKYYFDSSLTKYCTAEDYEKYKQDNLNDFCRVLFDELLVKSTDVVISSQKEFEDLDLEFQETYLSYKSFFTDLWNLLHQTSDLSSVKSGLADLLNDRNEEKKIIFGDGIITPDELLENFKVTEDGKILIDSKIIKSGKIRLVNKDAAAEKISRGFKKSIPSSVNKKVKKTNECELKYSEGNEDGVEVTLFFTYNENGEEKISSKKETCTKNIGSGRITINLPTGKEYKDIKIIRVEIKGRKSNVVIKYDELEKRFPNPYISEQGWNVELVKFNANGKELILGISFNWRG